MDFAAYFSLRELVQSVGQPLLVGALFLALALLASSAYPRFKRTGLILAAVIVTLALGYVLLIWFHVRIYQLLPLEDPATGTFFGRYMIPPWIENEKIYFWALLYSFWLIFMRKKTRALRVGTSFGLVLLIFMTLFTSNPFVFPLGDFTKQIIAMQQATGVQDPSTQAGAFMQASQMMKYFYNSAYMWIHPPLLFLAYSGFSVAFFGSLLMTFRRNSQYERLAYSWSKWGYLVLTMGLLIGYPWTIEAWKGQPWWFSPKINVTLMMWVLYSAYLHSRLYLNRRGMWKTTSVLGLLSFSAVIATYLSTYVLPGIHSVGGP